MIGGKFTWKKIREGTGVCELHWGRICPILWHGWENGQWTDTKYFNEHICQKILTFLKGIENISRLLNFGSNFSSLCPVFKHFFIARASFMFACRKTIESVGVENIFWYIIDWLDPRSSFHWEIHRNDGCKSFFNQPMVHSCFLSPNGQQVSTKYKSATGLWFLSGFEEMLAETEQLVVESWSRWFIHISRYHGICFQHLPLWRFLSTM